MVEIAVCIGVLWVVLRLMNMRKLSRLIADRTARLFVDELFVYKEGHWTFKRDQIISNEVMQTLIEEIKDGGAKL